MATKINDVKPEHFFKKSDRKRLLFWALYKQPLTRKEIGVLNIELFASGKKVRKPSKLLKELQEIEQMLADEFRPLGKREKKQKKERRKIIRQRLRAFKDMGMPRVLSDMVRRGWVEKRGRMYYATNKFPIDCIRSKWGRTPGNAIKAAFTSDRYKAFDMKMKDRISKKHLDEFEAFIDEVMPLRSSMPLPEYMQSSETKIAFLLHGLENAEKWDPFQAFVEHLTEKYAHAVLDRKLDGSARKAKKMMSFLPIILLAKGYDSDLKHFLYMTPEGKTDHILAPLPL